MTMITPSYLGETIEYSSLHACRSTLEDPTEHVLTIGPNGRIKAQVFAKSVIVLGEVTGNVTASDKVDIRDNGSVDGDIISPRVAIAEGAHFRGSVDMQRKSGAPAQPQAAKPVAVPAQPVAVVAGQQRVGA